MSPSPSSEKGKPDLRKTAEVNATENVVAHNNIFTRAGPLRGQSGEDSAYSRQLSPLQSG
eukprot:2194814-Pyramimonas_sp.AAC.2